MKREAATVLAVVCMLLCWGMLVVTALSRNSLTWSYRECESADEAQMFLGELSKEQANTAKVVYAGDGRTRFVVFFRREK